MEHTDDRHISREVYHKLSKPRPIEEADLGVLCFPTKIVSDNEPSDEIRTIIFESFRCGGKVAPHRQ